MPKLTEDEVKLILEGAVLRKLQNPNTFSWTKAISKGILPTQVFDFFSKKLHDSKFKMAMKIYADLMRENRLAPARFSDKPNDRLPMTHQQRVYTAARIAGTDPRGFATLFNDLIDDYQEQFQDDAELNKVKGLAGMQ
jgi:hypothetical protein